MEIDPHYVCSYADVCFVDQKLRGNDDGGKYKTCVPIRGDECRLKDGKYCQIEGRDGKCTDRNYCVPYSCRNDDDCFHEGLYFCKRSRRDVRNGRKGKCYLRSEL